MDAVQNQITPTDRLGLTLFLAVVVHGILILGLSFKALSEHLRQAPPTLNVTLVQTTSDKAPKKAKYLAQANQLASGSSDRAGHPGNPYFARNPMRSQGVAPIELHTETRRNPQTQQHPKTLTQRDSPYALPEAAPKPTPPVPDAPSGSRSIELNLAQARLTAEIRQAMDDYNKRPRRLFLDTVDAKSSIEAAYLAKWVRRVERIGNLNYPHEAARRHLHGRLILNVLINHDGRVLRIDVAQSSGATVLDDAAKRIVQLASPFPPFPKAMRKQYDQLMITRTWIFEADNTLRTAR